MNKVKEAIFLLLVLYLTQLINIPANPPIDIAAIPTADLSGLRFGSYGSIDYYKFNMKRQVQYKGKPITYFVFSPSENMLGFFYESSNYGNAEDVSLVIFNITKRTFKKIYTGGYRTSRWEWGDDKAVKVFYNCGTHCLYANEIDVEAGKELQKYHVYN